MATIACTVEYILTLPVFISNGANIIKLNRLDMFFNLK